MTPQQRASVKPRVFVAPIVNPYNPSPGRLASYACLYFVGANAHNLVTGDVELSSTWIQNLKSNNDLSIFVKTGTLSLRPSSKNNTFNIRTAELKSTIAKYSDANPHAAGIDRCSRIVAQALLDNHHHQCVMLMIPLWEYPSEITTFEIENQVRYKFVEGYLNLEVANAQENFIMTQKRDTWGNFSNSLNINFNRDCVI